MTPANHPAIDTTPAENSRTPRQPTAAATRAAGWLATLTTALLVLAALATGGLIVAGYQPSTERSNSMAPLLHRGDVLISRAIAPTEAHVGDVITFAAPRFEGVRLTHRVRSVRTLPDGRVAFVTRGDANIGTERWTIARDGQLTRLETHIPAVGLALIALNSHPMYLAIAVALALWSALFRVVWGGGRMPLPRPEIREPRARRAHGARRRISLLGVGALLVAGVSGTAVAAIVVANDAATPSATLVVNDGGQPLFVLLQMTPGETATACELVTNTGPDPADVGMYGLTTGTGLDSYLTLQITRGTLPAGTPAASCAGFNADSDDYTANGAGVIYSGMLSDLPTTADTALTDPVLAWGADGAVAFRMTVALIDTNSAQDSNATQRFYFGVIETPATTPTTITPTTTPPVSTTPVTTVPTSTTPATPDPSTPTTPTPRGVALNSDSVTSKGLLRLGITTYGKAKVTAKVYLYPKAKPRKGKKRKLILLGKATVFSSRAGRVNLAIKPKPAVLKRYRNHASRYRVRIVLTANYTTTKAYVTRSFVSQKSARRLASLRRTK
jgi:signal peptidase I